MKNKDSKRSHCFYDWAAFLGLLVVTVIFRLFQPSEQFLVTTMLVLSFAAFGIRCFQLFMKNRKNRTFSTWYLPIRCIFRPAYVWIRRKVSSPSRARLFLIIYCYVLHLLLILFIYWLKEAKDSLFAIIAGFTAIFILVMYLFTKHGNPEIKF